MINPSCIEYYTTDEDVLFCADYLSRNGKRFLVDYGYENATEMAAQVAREKLEAEGD